MDKKEKKRLIDQINKRITRAEKAFGFDEEIKGIWRKQLKDIVTNTDLLTENGLLSMSQKALAELDDMTLEVLKNNMPNTVKELKEEAMEKLEDIIESDSDLLAHKNEIISQEIISKIKITNMLEEKENATLVSDTLKDWASSLKSIDPMLEVENPELYAKIYDMDTATSNLKGSTYTNLLSILTDSKSIIDEYEKYKENR